MVLSELQICRLRSLLGDDQVGIHRRRDIIIFANIRLWLLSELLLLLLLIDEEVARLDERFLLFHDRLVLDFVVLMDNISIRLVSMVVQRCVFAELLLMRILVWDNTHMVLYVASCERSFTIGLVW